jgi:Cof subfamily protein (haloacid dehalogenase superfamily)
MAAMDLDGTMLDSEKRISLRTQEAIHRAMEQGTHIVISTGRSYSSLPEQVFEIDGLEYVINSNGASITNLKSGLRVYENCLETAAAAEVLEILQKNRCHFEVFVDGRAYDDQEEYEKIRKNGSTYRRSSYVLGTRTPVPDLYVFAMEHAGKLENINLNFADLEERSRMLKILKSREDITLTSSDPHNLEIGNRTTSKAEALRCLSETLSVNRNEVIAFGDSMNDFKMLEFAGIAVAMGNADERLKQAADLVTKTNDDDGVAIVMEVLLDQEV